MLATKRIELEHGFIALDPDSIDVVRLATSNDPELHAVSLYLYVCDRQAPLILTDKDAWAVAKALGLTNGEEE